MPIRPAQLSLAAIQARLESAQKRLGETDADANGRITKDEAGVLPAGSLPREAWSAGSKVWGDRYLTTSGNGWEARLNRRYALTPQDLQNLQNQALRVLFSMVPVGATSIPAEALEKLPEAVDAYWKQTFGAKFALLPEQREALVNLILQAADETWSAAPTRG